MGITIITEDAIEITSRAAILAGELSDDSDSESDAWFDSSGEWYGVEAFFEYGPTVAYGSSTTPEEVSSEAMFDAFIDELAHDTVFHFRAVVTASGHTWYGADNTFRTLQLAVATAPASNIEDQGATLNGSFAGLSGNLSVNTWFQWGRTTGYGFGTPTTARTVPAAFDSSLVGLMPATFHFRAAISDGYNTVYGADEAFEIAALPTSLSDMSVAWLFHVGSHYWSTQSVTVGGRDYDAKIDPESFTGITLSRGYSGNDRIHLIEDVTVHVANPDNTAINPDDLIDEAVTISVYVDDNNGSASVWRVFKMRVKDAQNYYQRIMIVLEDEATAHMEAVYPKTKLVEDVYQAVGNTNDGTAFPVPFGTPYINLPNVLVGDTTYYVLGVAGQAYSISRVHAPEGFAVSEWDATDHDFVQSTDSGNRLFQAKIAGTVESGGRFQGVFLSGVRRPIRTRYSRADTVDTTNPADVISDILFSGTMSVLNACWIDVRARGAFNVRLPRHEHLAQMLDQIHACFTFLLNGDHVTRTLCKTPIREFTSAWIVQDSFRYTKVLNSADYDGGVIEYTLDGDPQDIFYRASLEIDGGVVPDNPDSGSLVMPHLVGYDETHRMGVLYFQRRLGVIGQITFEARPEALVLNPDDVITITGPDYGGPVGFDAVTTRISIDPDLVVTINAVRHGHDLHDYEDLPTYTEPTVEDVDPLDFNPWVIPGVGPKSWPSGGFSVAGVLKNPEAEFEELRAEDFEAVNIETEEVEADKVDSKELLENGKRVTCYGVKTITGNYELTAKDYGMFIRGDDSGGLTVTVNSAVSFPPGTVVTFEQVNDGQITFAGTGAMVVNRQAHTKTAGKYAIAAIVQETSNVWVLGGDTGT